MIELAFPRLSQSLTRVALIVFTLFGCSGIRSAHAQTFDWRSDGLVWDAFTFDGEEVWTVEDGGRIRHRASSTSGWTFQDVPDHVQDSLHRIQFIGGTDDSDGPTGWAVGEHGAVLRTTTGGDIWLTGWGGTWPAVLPGPGVPERETLWDVHFIDACCGWIAGLHGIWKTIDGGLTWERCILEMGDGTPIFGPDFEDEALLGKIELYSLDVLVRSPEVINPAEPFEGLVGLACGEPGLVFRTTDGVTWRVVFDIRCLCTQSGCGPPHGCDEGLCYPCTGLQPIDGCLGQPAVPAGSRDCQFDVCDAEALQFEAWDVEQSRNPTEKLAVVVGGIQHNCGMVFTSTNDGLNWKAESSTTAEWCSRRRTMG